MCKYTVNVDSSQQMLIFKFSLTIKTFFFKISFRKSTNVYYFLIIKLLSSLNFFVQWNSQIYDIKGYPQKMQIYLFCNQHRMRLDSRLNQISTVCFLIYMDPTSKLLNKQISSKRWLSTLFFFQEFQVVFTAHPLKVNLYLN